MDQEGDSVKKQFYTWREFDADISRITVWVKAQNFSSVYWIPRGGLIVAVALSHRLWIPLKIQMSEIDKDTLVVDDIADSGKTLEKFESQLSFKPRVATPFSNKDFSRVPDFYCREKTDWVVFPWETEGSLKYDNTF